MRLRYSLGERRTSQGVVLVRRERDLAAEVVTDLEGAVRLLFDLGTTALHAAEHDDVLVRIPIATAGRVPAIHARTPCGTSCSVP